MTQTALNLDRLLKARLAIARHGEMDVARWWNTKGMLGHTGAVVLKRGFPSTHHPIGAFGTLYLPWRPLAAYISKEENSCFLKERRPSCSRRTEP